MDSQPEKAFDTVVLLSGGIDSSTVLAKVRKEMPRRMILALSMWYGQKHSVELEAARKVAAFNGVNHRHIQLDPSLFEGAGSTLIDLNKPNPETTYAELAASKGISPTYVPFRNGNLLSAATAFCLTLGASADQPIELFYGAHAEDAKNWAYPDCTPEFNGAMAAAIFIGSYQAVRLVTPLQFSEKHEIIQLGHKLLAPFHLTYSCYNGGAIHCGKCPTCVARHAAFAKAKVIDPTTYEAIPDVSGVL